MSAPKTAPIVYSGTLFQTRGPPFNAVPFNPLAVTPTAVGTGIPAFSDANNGTFTYTINNPFVSQTKAITREIFAAPGTVCQWLASRIACVRLRRVHPPARHRVALRQDAAGSARDRTTH